MIDSAAEFVKLRTSDDPQSQRRAATDEASISVWNETIRLHPSMKIWVVRNKSIPLEVLSQLSTDPDPSVRCEVAMKRKLTSELFVQLANDPDLLVRATVARNPRLPDAERVRLAEMDPSSLVRNAATEARAAADHR